MRRETNSGEEGGQGTEKEGEEDSGEPGRAASNTHTHILHRRTAREAQSQSKGAPQPCPPPPPPLPNLPVRPSVPSPLSAAAVAAADDIDFSPLLLSSAQPVRPSVRRANASGRRGRTDGRSRQEAGKRRREEGRGRKSARMLFATAPAIDGADRRLRKERNG